MTDGALVHARGVTKTIRGTRILRGLDLDVDAGEVVGFVGPNGAGKTTFIRILTGMTLKSGGALRVCGVDAGDGTVHANIGLLPEAPGFIEHLTGFENLRLLASIRRAINQGEVEFSIGLVGLDPNDRRPVSKYSLGMRQRLGLAQAIMERPELLILDEPANGLDVIGIAMLRRLIRDEAARGAGILLASHLLTEVELSCDRVAMIRDGEVIADLDTPSLRRIAGRIEIRVTTPEDWVLLGRAYPSERNDDAPGDVSGVMTTEDAIPEVVRRLVGLGVSIESIAPASSTLEDVFIATMKGEWSASQA